MEHPMTTTARFVTNDTDSPVSRHFTHDFPNTAELFKHLALIADEATVYIVSVTSADGRWIGQYRTGAGHRDFPTAA
jgi:hypothetical protein